ncbi:hypothetical protein HanPI659440_Chr03g0099181 [Helianthus annuus]|nr:hypothetical protein HanPI659440_Chr03g0099181 [Helianthus annuus]
MTTPASQTASSNNMYLKACKHAEKRVLDNAGEFIDWLNRSLPITNSCYDIMCNISYF